MTESQTCDSPQSYPQPVGNRSASADRLRRRPVRSTEATELDDAVDVFARSRDSVDRIIGEWSRRRPCAASTRPIRCPAARPRPFATVPESGYSTGVTSTMGSRQWRGASGIVAFGRGEQHELGAAHDAAVAVVDVLERRPRTDRAADPTSRSCRRCARRSGRARPRRAPPRAPSDRTRRRAT